MHNTLRWLFLVCFSINAHTDQATIHTQLIAHDTLAITITIPLAPPEVLYRDYIGISVDHPAIALSPWKTAQSSIMRYDPTFKKDKQVFTSTLTLFLQAHATASLTIPVSVHLTYSTSKSPTVAHHRIFPLSFNAVPAV